MRVKVICRWPSLSAWRAGQVIFLVLTMVFATGCVPYFYEGKAAILIKSPNLEVTQKSRSWGDCYFKIKRMPTVYQLEAERYTITITQGARYWPEFYFEVFSSVGLGLEIAGEHIGEVQYLDGGDMRRLRDARGTNPTHKTARLTEVPNGVLSIKIIDNAGQVIGEHSLRFVLVDVNCFDWDAI